MIQPLGPVPGNLGNNSLKVQLKATNDKVQSYPTDQRRKEAKMDCYHTVEESREVLQMTPSWLSLPLPRCSAFV